MRVQHTLQAIAAFLVGAAVVSLALVFILPLPPTGISNFSNFGQLILLSLLGPILFVWAWGPGPMGAFGLLAAVAIPAASIATLLLGFVRKKSYFALICAAAIWSLFGGFSVFVAAMGSI
jgi:hypothetical protein